jgi:hypothetical protein
MDCWWVTMTQDEVPLRSDCVGPPCELSSLTVSSIPVPDQQPIARVSTAVASRLERAAIAVCVCAATGPWGGGSSFRRELTVFICTQPHAEVYIDCGTASDCCALEPKPQASTSPKPLSC